MTVLLQHLLPQHLLSRLMGQLADSSNPWLKNKLIKRFIKHYDINMQEALNESPEDYRTFNDFFIRKLKPELRIISPGPFDIASPVDGCIAQIGHANGSQLLQAKGLYFDLPTLLGGDKELARGFTDAFFATLYLAPHNYHRVHMPITGNLIKTIYVPGKLFSVNRMTTELVPNLYGRNERLIAIFDTEAGPCAIILVGAMIVGSIQPAWSEEAVRAKSISSTAYSAGPRLAKGEEMGHFKLGSTVILLFPKDSVRWRTDLTAGMSIKLGQCLGNCINISKITDEEDRKNN